MPASTNLARSKALLASLELTLENLRQSWSTQPTQWPGLDCVLERCWAHLNIPRQGLEPRTAALQTWSLTVARQIEQQGQRQSSKNQEPAYHNRLHIADTLVCMTHLLMALRQQSQRGAGVAHLECLCLAVMAGHDFMHPGGSNTQPAQFERMAVEALKPLMQEAGLDASDQATIEHCILHTDPVCVKSSHQTAGHRPFDLADIDWMTVLVQEADILASTLPLTQQSLTQALSHEWASSNPDAAAKLLLPYSRMMFLEHAALFSSPAAQRLGLEEVKARQVKGLLSQI